MRGTVADSPASKIRNRQFDSASLSAWRQAGAKPALPYSYLAQRCFLNDYRSHQIGHWPRTLLRKLHENQFVKPSRMVIAGAAVALGFRTVLAPTG
jgi:hypothetical protein